MTIGFDSPEIRDDTIRCCCDCGYAWYIVEDEPCPMCEPVDDGLGAAAWLLVPIFGLLLVLVAIVVFVATWIYRALT